MDVYDVTVKANVYILANSNEEAEEIAKDAMGEDFLSACLPSGVPDFTFQAYRTPNQEEWLKKRAINLKGES